MSRVLAWVFDSVMRNPLRDFRRNLERPFSAQETSLKRILSTAADTDFGKAHGFADAAAHTGPALWRRFRKNVPIRSYADFAPHVERMKQAEPDILIPGHPLMFSLTSGTTADPKFCPINRAFIKEHHRQHLLWMYKAFRDHPRLNQGKYLVVASPAEMGRTAGGIPYGAMSGKQLEVQSIPVRRRQAAPVEVQNVEPSDVRWFNLALFGLAEENLSVVTAVNPSSLVTIADLLSREGERLVDCIENGHPAARDATASPIAKRLAKLFRPNPERARRLREILRADGNLSPSAVWPNLEMLFTWQGGSSAFYLPHVTALWGDTPQRCLGLRASEGTFSIPERDRTATGTLAVGGHAMEFVPSDDGEPRPDSPTLLAGELEEGGLYRLIATTSGGFYRYDMGDLVRVTGFNKKTPEIAFERRAGSVLSATGEKVTENQVVAAMESTAVDGPLLNGFTLTWEMEEGQVRYVLAVEPVDGEKTFRERPGLIRERLLHLIERFDAELGARNIEYSSKREDGRIAAPRILLLADRSYDNYRKARAAEGRPDSQVKQPLLVRPPSAGRAPVPGCPFFDDVRLVAEIAPSH